MYTLKETQTPVIGGDYNKDYYVILDQDGYDATGEAYELNEALEVLNELNN
jgi:hypothetical protein